jgi:peroxiredoxin family protein
METILTLKDNKTEIVSYYTWDQDHNLESLKFLTQLCKGRKITACSGDSKLAEYFREELRLGEIDHAANRKHRMNVFKLMSVLLK